jgi:hypothetical protein
MRTCHNHVESNAPNFTAAASLEVTRPRPISDEAETLLLVASANFPSNSPHGRHVRVRWLVHWPRPSRHDPDCRRQARTTAGAVAATSRPQCQRDGRNTHTLALQSSPQDHAICCYRLALVSSGTRRVSLQHRRRSSKWVGASASDHRYTRSTPSASLADGADPQWLILSSFCTHFAAPHRGRRHLRRTERTQERPVCTISHLRHRSPFRQLATARTETAKLRSGTSKAHL